MSAQRIGALDCLRLVSATAIVWLHTPESDLLKPSIALCRFAVPAFTACSVFLLLDRIQRGSSDDARRYSRARALHFYVLFLLWNFLYLLARLAKHGLFGRGDTISYSPLDLLFSGVAHQLWFLPFLSLVTLVLGALAWRYGTCSAASRSILLAALAVCGTIVGCLPVPHLLPRETQPLLVTMGWNALPSALFAFPLQAMAQSRRRRRGHSAPSLALLAVGLAALALSLQGTLSVLLQNLSGTALVGAALLAPEPAQGGACSSLARLTLPVYLLHVLLIEGLQALGHRLIPHTSATFDVLVFSLALLGSFLIASAVSRASKLSWFLSLGRV